jgi:hypothetical protein
MQSIRLILITSLAVIGCATFAACSDDDEDDTSSGPSGPGSSSSSASGGGEGGSTSSSSAGAAGGEGGAAQGGAGGGIGGAGGTAGAGGAGGTGGGGSLVCEMDPTGLPCEFCVKEDCCPALEACVPDANCNTCWGCLELKGVPEECTAECDDEAPLDKALLECITASCSIECQPT